MQTHLTQQEYNNINNANTLDELLNIKNQILASSVVSENSSTGGGNVLVRCLSLEEYDKYIKNSTLDGSITKNNYNVWHNMTTTGNAYMFGLGLDVYNDRYWGSASYNRWPSQRYTLSNVIRFNFNDKQAHTVNMTCACELIQFSVTLNTIAYFDKQQFFELITRYYNNGVFYVNLVSVSLYKENINKNNTTCLKELTNRFYDKYGIYQYESRPAKLIINAATAFRPVLNYVDNKKSKNIYS